jgi:hypothetical protein
MGFTAWILENTWRLMVDPASNSFRRARGLVNTIFFALILYCLIASIFFGGSVR